MPFLFLSPILALLHHQKGNLSLQVGLADLAPNNNNILAPLGRFLHVLPYP